MTLQPMTGHALVATVLACAAASAFAQTTSSGTTSPSSSSTPARISAAAAFTEPRTVEPAEQQHGHFGHRGDHRAFHDAAYAFLAFEVDAADLGQPSGIEADFVREPLVLGEFADEAGDEVDIGGDGGADR